MIQHAVRVIENVRLAERTFRLRVADAEIGRLIRPGQFVMLRIPHANDPLLGRPFALYDTWLDASGVAGYDLVFLVVGKITTLMSQLKTGDTVEVWGPLGNGFSLGPTRHLMMVAGGIGQTPFPAVARAYLKLRPCDELDEVSDQTAEGSGPHTERTHAAKLGTTHFPPCHYVTLCYGVRSASYLAGLDDFRALGVDVRIATDDGSAGHRGFVTELVQQALAGGDLPSRLVGCGPEPMMHQLQSIAAAAGVPCELSLETPMACGIGACFSCVAKICQDDGRWDYRRVCVEGPVFDSSRVVFERE